MDYKDFLNRLVEVLYREGGSDIHFSENRYPIIRVRGELFELENFKILEKTDLEALLDIILIPEYKNFFLENKEIDFSFEVNTFRFRGTCFFSQGSVSISLRLVPKKIGTFSELNLPTILESFIQKPQGFFLVVGPMGHGKSTTLASMVELINQKRKEHIITIEDPIEHVFQKGRSVIDQREVRLDTKDFPTALKAAFRQDADVLMIGEMRGLETISTAVTAAETGHLVFSTLHTNNASQTVDRIIDVFPPQQQNQIKIQLAASLLGVFSQRLLPRVSGGMIPAYELMINNIATANLIREGRTFEINNVIETSSSEGMISLRKSLENLVRSGEVSLENAKKYSQNINI